jgi:hypothetical protein
MSDIMDSSNTITSRTEPLAETTQNIVDEYIKTPLKNDIPSKSSGNGWSMPKISMPKMSMPKMSMPKSLQNIESSEPVKKSKKGWMILKMVVILGVFGYIFYKMKPIFSIITSVIAMFRHLIPPANKQFRKETKGLDKEKEKPKKPRMKGMPTGTPNLSKQTIIPKKDSGVKYKTPPAGPVPDDSMSEIQHKKHHAGAGHCYIGKWKGYRSCISVNNPKECYSGETYSTNEACIHPEMRS